MDSAHPHYINLLNHFNVLSVLSCSVALAFLQSLAVIVNIPIPASYRFYVHSLTIRAEALVVLCCVWRVPLFYKGKVFPQAPPPQPYHLLA